MLNFGESAIIINKTTASFIAPPSMNGIAPQGRKVKAMGKYNFAY